MPYQLGSRSRQELNGVHQDLVWLVKESIKLTPIDFAVHDGIRTEAEQREYVRTGASKTMNSRHLTGHAVDLVPYVGAKLRWEWPLIYPITATVARQAFVMDIPLTWGGCWCRVDRWHLEFADADYVERAHDGWDGPHFELAWEEYPA